MLPYRPQAERFLYSEFNYQSNSNGRRLFKIFRTKNIYFRWRIIQYAENDRAICLLARIEGAPSGTKGYYLYLFSKIIGLEADGSLKKTMFMTVAIFKKMGQTWILPLHI